MYQSVSSVTQSCPTLCDPLNCSMPGLLVHHKLPEFIQTHVHRVDDAIQPSYPLLSPSPPAPNPSHNVYHMKDFLIPAGEKHDTRLVTRWTSALRAAWQMSGDGEGRDQGWPHGPLLVGTVGCFKSKCQCFKTLAISVFDVTWRSAWEERVEGLGITQIFSFMPVLPSPLMTLNLIPHL